MKEGRWYELYPSVLGQRRSSLRFFVRSVSGGLQLRCERRWSRRIVAEKVHPLTWMQELDIKHRSSLVDSFMEKLLQSNGDIAPTGKVDPAFQKMFPTLWAFLSCTSVKIGEGEWQPRKTATISIYLGIGGPQAFLNDRACSRCLTVTADTFGGLWKALEDALAVNPIPWRHLDGWTPEKKTTSRKRNA